MKKEIIKVLSEQLGDTINLWAINKAAERLEALFLEQKESGWISVDERLPEEETQVWFVTKKYPKVVSCGTFFTRGEFRYFSTISEHAFSAKLVDRYIPINKPQPPQ